jgi:hypothetical protein
MITSTPGRVCAWTIYPATRQEMLDRLLELNHERCAAEQGTTVEQARQDGLF